MLRPGSHVLDSRGSTPTLMVWRGVSWALGNGLSQYLPHATYGCHPWESSWSHSSKLAAWLQLSNSQTCWLAPLQVYMPSHEHQTLKHSWSCACKPNCSCSARPKLPPCIDSQSKCSACLALLVIHGSFKGLSLGLPRRLDLTLLAAFQHAFSQLPLKIRFLGICVQDSNLS